MGTNQAKTRMQTPGGELLRGVQDYSPRWAVTRTNTCPGCSAASASRRLMGVTHTTRRCDCNHCCPLPSAGCPLTGGRAGLAAGCCFYYQLYGPSASVARKSSAGLQEMFSCYLRDDGGLAELRGLGCSPSCLYARTD